MGKLVKKIGRDTSHERGDVRSPNEIQFSSKWITENADKDMIAFCEKSGRKMANGRLTNSKIRSIYGEIKRIQMGRYEDGKISFLLLKPKVAYALARDERNEGLKLFKKIFDDASYHVNDQKSFDNFCDFFEAILAYHKAFGGRE